MIALWMALTALAALTAAGQTPQIEKALLYDQYTLEDTWEYNGKTRGFQYDKIHERLAMADSIQVPTAYDNGEPDWAILQNHRNEHGTAPDVKNVARDEYNAVTDPYGVTRHQSVPLYARGEFGSKAPECYGRDGSLARLVGFNADSTAYLAQVYNAPEGVWEVPKKFVKLLDKGQTFEKAIMIDDTNQCIMTLERDGEKWLVRSMNPCSTGAHNPPYQRPTPTGLYVVQEHKPKMFYTGDGNSTIVGYAPWASRITNGAYMHGVPTNSPEGAIIEFSQTLGTTPRSHECVRNSSSHAKFIYDWAPVGETLVFVYD